MAGLPGKHDTAARVGSVYRLPVVHTEDDETTPIDITGYTINMPIRVGHSGTLIGNFSTDPDGGITITDAVAGEFEVVIPATTTAGWTPLRYARYDIIMTPPSGVEEEFVLMTGKFEILSRVDPQEAA